MGSDASRRSDKTRQQPESGGSAKRPPRRSRGAATSGLNTYGRWCVLDTQRIHGPQSQIGLLSVGTERKTGARLFEGQSITSWFSSPARALLVPRVSLAVETRREVNDKVLSYGAWVKIRVIPLLDPYDQLSTDPRDHTVTAVLAYHGPPDEPIPAPPLGGVWQWRIPKIGVSDKQIRAYWSAGIFDLFEVPRPKNVDAEYPSGIWRDGSAFFDDLVPLAWRDNVYTAFDYIYSISTDELVVRTYQRTISNGELRTQRMSARAYLEVPGPVVIARGYTGEIPQPNNLERPPGTEPIGATILNTIDKAICVINLRAAHIYSTTEPFRRLGLSLGSDPRVGSTSGRHVNIFDLCHPDDRIEFEELLNRAARKPMVIPDKMRIRLAATAGGYRTLNVAPVGVSNIGAHESHLIVCYVTDPSEATSTG